MSEQLISEVKRTVRLCSAPALSPNIPLRVKKELAGRFLMDSEFRQAATEDLLWLAKERKHVYVTDRASAIAALKGDNDSANFTSRRRDVLGRALHLQARL